MTAPTSPARDTSLADLAGGVDTKCDVNVAFGNDGDGVDTKPLSEQNFGNDGLGFIRVRKRELKGGHPKSKWRGTAARGAHLASTSASFDLVRAVRVAGKPRHQFVLGLGSQKDTATGRDAAWMLLRAIGRMKRHGLDASQRQVLLAELIRKGVRRPTVADCECWKSFSWMAANVDELVAWLRATTEAAP